MPTDTPAPSAIPSATAVPSPSPSPSIPSVLPELSDIVGQMEDSCGTDVLCPVVRDLLPNAAWAPLLASLVTVVLTVIIAMLLRKIVHRLIDRATNRAAAGVLPERLRAKIPSGESGVHPVLAERRRQRAGAIGSVLRHIASIVIYGTAVLMILANLGINLGPLLASLGIAGVAVGFAAQEPIKDFIAGVFMLLEDQYGVGDVVDVGPAVGTVEAVTLRIIRLRDADGRVWYIRNATITRLANESQGWSRALVDVPVAYDSDIPTVRELLREVVTGIWEDPEFRDTLLVEKPEVFDLEQITDTALVFRITAKTVPGKQGQVARELRLRIKTALDARGLAIAPLPAA